MALNRFFQLGNIGVGCLHCRWAYLIELIDHRYVKLHTIARSVIEWLLQPKIDSTYRVAADTN
jgi:hypothetical protein